jgi:hypothetical protein
VRTSILPPPNPARHRIPPADGVTVTLTDGRRLERRFQQPLGHPDRPVNVEALWLKFLYCTRVALSEPVARRLFELLQNLERVTSPAEFPTIAVDP